MKQILFLFLLFPFLTIAQSGEATYKLYLVDKDDPKSSPKEIKGLIYELKFNHSNYSFQIPNTLASDFKQNSVFLHAIRTNTSTLIFRDFENDQKLMQVNLMDEKVFANINDFKCDWKILDERSLVNEIRSKSALCKIDKNSKFSTKNKNSNDVKAWFSPEINFKVGPAGFDNLPGLITKLQLGNYLFILDNLKISEKSMVIKKPSYVILTMDEINDLFKSKTGVDVNERLKKLNDN